MSSSEPAFPLLSLPDLILMAVVEWLEEDGRHSLASSCRALAMSVSAASESTWALVTSKTSWKGLCKVLPTKLMNCKALETTGSVTDGNDVVVEDSALSMLLDSVIKPMAGCSFSGIEYATITKAQPLPCLLPPNIASVIPDLKYLTITDTPLQHVDPQPVSYCSSLCGISYRSGADPGLPSRYHTAEDLRRQLPNISNLVLCRQTWEESSNVATDTFVDTMLQAWGDQLTKLEINTDNNIQHCTRLQSLAWSSDALKPSLDCLPTTLTTLDLGFDIEEAGLPAILQLPLLRVLAVRGFKDLQHDWSKHPCTWQQLSVSDMQMALLSKLPMHSLKGDGCLEIEVLRLPNPLLPGSLDAVKRAAQCVSNAGITIDGCQGWRCMYYNRDPSDPKQDLPSVELVQVASRVMTPFEQLNTWPDGLLHYPKTITATIKWSSPSLEIVNVPMFKLYEASEAAFSWFWIALQCCHNLSSIIFTFSREEVCKCTDQLRQHVLLAAKHYVTTTGNQLTIVGGFLTKPTADEEPQQATLQLQSNLQQELPSTVSLEKCSWSTSCKFIVKLSPAETLPAAAVNA